MSQTLLAVHSGALGDVILFGRLLERLPGRRILLAGRDKARLLQSMGVVDVALDFDSLPMGELFNDEPLVDCDLPRYLEPCDRLISCFAEPGSAAALRLAALSGAESASFLPVRPPADYAGHLVDLWADLLGQAPTQGRLVAWPVPDAWSRAGDLLSADESSHRRLVVLHPGSGGQRKCWPLARFLALADRLAQDGLRVVSVIGPVEQEIWAADGRLEKLAGREVLQSPPLETLAGLLGRADGFVGNDSGPTHLAAACGTPTVAIFGCSDPVQFAPLGPRVRVVEGQQLEQIPVSRVAEVLLEEIRP